MKHFPHGWPGQAPMSAVGAAAAVAILALIAAALIGAHGVPTGSAVRVEHVAGGINSLIADPKESLELVPPLPSIAPDAEIAQPIDTF